MLRDPGVSLPLPSASTSPIVSGPRSARYRYRNRVLVDNSSVPTFLSSLRQRCNVLGVMLMTRRSLVTLRADAIMTLDTDSRQQQLVFVVCLPSEYY